MQPRQSRIMPVVMLGLTVLVVLAFVTIGQRNRPAGSRSTFYSDYVGRPAVPFTLNDLQGNAVSSAAMEGKVVVLDLWATWCPPCVEGLPKLGTLAAKYADKGVVFQAINLGDAPDTVRAFVKERNITVPVLLDPDSKVGLAYSAQYIPLTIVIGRDGRILAHANLAPDEAETQLTQWIESALKSGQAS